MEPTTTAAAAHTTQEIELVIEETVVYELTWRIQIKYPPQPLGQRVALSSLFQSPKVRPIARVLPAIRERKRSQSTENYDIWDTDKSILKPQVLTEDSLLVDPVNVYNFTTEKQAGRTEAEQKVHIPLSHSSCNLETTQFHKKPPSAAENYESARNKSDPCARHRDCVRREFLQARSNRKKITADMDCIDGEGCHADIKDIDKQSHKETTISDCLEEFLSGLHLSHLLDYLKVLGCMCVRDLRLLEMPELEAIQLISRRRLLQQLDSLSLHHEAPPEGCSLEAWLTWYGLTHISGFLTAIGVHSVGDLRYLREDDLVLLKPVTRRRIIACNRK